MKYYLKWAVVVTILCVVLSTTASGHEMYYVPNGPSTYITYPLKFYDTTSYYGPELKVYTYFPNTTAGNKYSSQYQAGVSAWSGMHNGTVLITTQYVSSYSNSNVNITVMTDSLRTAHNISPNTLGYSILFGMDGSMIKTYAQASSQTYIKSATILLTDDLTDFGYGSITTSELNNRIQKTTAHEIGHAIGLGPPHTYYPIPATTPSVMKQGFYSTDATNPIPKTPAAHDKSDLYKKYYQNLST